MRRVLELASDERQSFFWIGATRGRRGTRAADEAARRACKRLAEQGHIELACRSLIADRVHPPDRACRTARQTRVPAKAANRRIKNADGNRLRYRPHRRHPHRARAHQTALRCQILAILPEIELFIIAFDCGLNPRSPRTKPALITWDAD